MSGVLDVELYQAQLSKLNLFLPEVFKSTFRWTIYYPLQYLYFKSWWKGAEWFDICTQLSNVDSIFWRQHPEKCAEMILKDFESYLFVAFIGLYFIMLWKSIHVFIRIVGRLFT
jgi:hypothetical protein